MLTTYHGLVSYDTGQIIQQKTHEKVSAGGEDETLIFEHPHVYTLGRMGKHEDILIEGQIVKNLGIEIRNTDRGGEVTYHGPGQLVVYPIVKLDRIAYSPSEYVRALKISIIDCLDNYGIIGNKKDMPTGVWVENKKIAAIGVRVSKKTTSHGLALNVHTDLSYFSHIIPCGIHDCLVTSIKEEVIEYPTMKDVAYSVGCKLGKVLRKQIVWQDISSNQDSDPSPTI